MESIKQNFSEEMFRPQVEVIYNELIKTPEISEALNLLDSLPKNLKYHDKNHTIDVIKETILFALADGLADRDIEIECIAAAWHDVGYLKQYRENEPVAVEIFKQSQAFKNLPKSDSDEIIANILDTQMVTKDGKQYLLMERSKLGYILDGDVSIFGREDFFDKNRILAEELGIDMSNNELKKEYYSSSIGLLKNYEWKTESAKKMRQHQKEINLKELEKRFIDGI